MVKHSRNNILSNFNTIHILQISWYNPNHLPFLETTAGGRVDEAEEGSKISALLEEAAFLESSPESSSSES